MVEKYEALLSKVTKRSKRAKLMSVQGVLFGFTWWYKRRTWSVIKNRRLVIV